MSYSPGTFSWADLSTPDIGAAKAFYVALVGWDFEALPAAEGIVWRDGARRAVRRHGERRPDGRRAGPARRDRVRLGAARQPRRRPRQRSRRDDVERPHHGRRRDR